MLKLKNVCKKYLASDGDKTVLNNINLDFKSKELVFVLGASGSGKSTLLNIIGGNLKCDSGKVYYDNLCITEFRDNQLDSYRRCIVSTIFQDYNLIAYLSVWDNVMLACNKSINRDKVVTILKQFGLYEKRNMVASKLSGGEKQRVAIARALASDAKIILADEPTGALDSKTSIEVMDYFKKIANEKLVIVVTHNTFLAKKYADRIINIKDGKCYASKVFTEDDDEISLEANRYSIRNIFKLGFRFLKNKIWRTLFTSSALAIGFIAMILVTSIYNNFNHELNMLEKRIVAFYPITISNGAYNYSNSVQNTTDNKIIFGDKNIHMNVINEAFLNYIRQIDSISDITYDYNILLPLITDSYKIISNDFLDVMPLNNNYDLLYGQMINDSFEVLIRVDNNNTVDSSLLTSLGFSDDVSYDSIVGKKIKVILNNQYFIKNSNYYIVSDDMTNLYDNSFIELTIVGIVKEREAITNKSGILCNRKLIDMVLDENSRSMIVNDLLTGNYKVYGIDNQDKDLLSYLGYNALPNKINIYVDNYYNKQLVIKRLDDYNLHNNKLIYVDSIASSINVVRNFMTIISGILIFFSFLSLLISSLMIGILTSVRVLECKKEIGILRSLGYSRRNIRMLFNLENILIGTLAFIISLIVFELLRSPLNLLFDKYLTISNLLNYNWQYLFGILVFNLVIIYLAGVGVSRHASKLDIVKCIYQ